MAKFRIYFFETATGEKIVEDQIVALARSHPGGVASLRAGLKILEEMGADPGLNRFTRLRHVGANELWELKVNVRPAQRALFVPIPGESAFVVLSVVPKTSMASDGRRQIDQALENLSHWLEDIFRKDSS